MAHALDLLSILAEAERPVRIVEIAQRLGVAPSTAHRLLATLVEAGFATRSTATHRYRRGPSLVRLGSRPVVPPILVQQVAHAHLERLAARMRLSTNLAVLDGIEVIAVDHVDPQRPGRHVDGARLPAHATALGQAILAYAPAAVDAVIAAGLTRHTARTPSDEAILRQTLADVRRRGYSVNVGYWKPDTAGVAAAIRDQSGDVVAAIGFTGSTDVVRGRETIRLLGLLAANTARAIGTHVGRAASHG